ncbi:helix-turn-helix domain-containing protein [Pseudoxanthomonas helianthi]|uniref:Helix-turn-helix domain-containing protein n=1 Tax=Pseudoxanthomonas helianthi TaxID=1453541 RepID=A0A940X1Q4_9GAMM|nr:helix-turn-helix domain-containing protein [Pseudoxanthomonas helianthi]
MFQSFGVSPVSAPHTLPETPLNPHDAAKFLGVSVPTLYKWRRYGGGPTFVKYGHHTVRYFPSDLGEFVSRHRSSSNRR